jgi:hypothetical protein
LRHHALGLAHTLLGFAQRSFLLRQGAVGGLACGGFGFNQHRLQARLLRRHFVQCFVRGTASGLLSLNARLQLL